MSDRFVIVHTDERGNIETLATVVYTDRAEAERRVAERRRTAAARGWSDRYELFHLVPADAVPGLEAERDALRKLVAGLVGLYSTVALGDGSERPEWPVEAGPEPDWYKAEVSR